jgi:hypothetical protein
MSLFVDLIELSEPRTNAALEFMCKASHDDDDAVWLPMDSPFIRRLVELFTQRGLMRLDAFRVDLQAWAEGQRHREHPERPARPDGAMERWTSAELALVKLYLEAVPPAQYTLDDWMMLTEYLFQRYLPADDMRTEAEWLATKATLMGRVQANMEKIGTRQADAVIAALPATVHAAETAFDLTPRQRATLDFARVRAAENVRALTEDVRHKMRTLIAQHAERQMLKVPGTPGTALQTELVDAFAALNRDWRRVAVTEAAEASNQGFIGTLKPGARVKRVEQYKGVCAWCAKINGRILEVVDPSAPDKDGETQVWVGKTNIGRSAAPRKRVGDLLVEREPHERYWIAAGTQHPHCRGRWIPVADAQPGDDPAFAEWLSQLLEKKP